MSWAFDPSNWAGLSHGPTYQDFVNVAADIHAWGGDVVGGGNVLRTVGAVQLLAGDLPGTAYSVTGATWSGGTATVTVGTHHVVVGQLVTVASVTPTGYNVSLQPVTAVTGTTVSYAVAVNPGAWTSGGTLTVGTTPQAGMIGVDGSGVLKRYFSGAWTSITAASQTPWAQAIDGGGFALSNVASLVLNPGALPTGAAGKLAVTAAWQLKVYDGTAWQFTGIQDPGSNGLLKRTALNTTTAAAAGTDYYAPGGTIARADLPAMVGSGGSHAAGIVPDPGSTAGTTKFLREDGSWAVPAATGLADPGSNCIVKRTAANTTAAAVAGSDFYAPGTTIAFTDLPLMGASGASHRPGAVPDPGSSAGTTKFLREDGSWVGPVGGVSVATTTPSDGQVLAYSAATGLWQPTAPGGSSANATQIQGRNVVSTAPTDGQALVWSSGSSQWQPSTLASQWTTSGSDIYFSGGKVGLGTTTPSLAAEVAATANGLPATSGTTQTGILRLSQTGNGVVDMGFGGAGMGWIQSTSKANLATSFPVLLNPNGGFVGINMTSAPTSPLQVVGLATYASDAAAGTGGLSAGALYKHSDGSVYVKL